MTADLDPDAGLGPLGPRLREARAARRLSVRELARRVGCSASLISQIERGASVPSVGVLYALATELGSSLDYLLFGSGAGAVVQRGGDRKIIDLASGVRWERLTPRSEAMTDFLEVIYSPGGHSTDERRPLRHDGREYALVLSGMLTANIGFESYDLEPGDSIAFDASTPHEYLNKTGEVVRAISVVVHTAPGRA
ncbi:MAG: XRE family transcriptional regulator [Streptosporangiaceae bacterium]|jgi:transcriptional regulator with XRE-family HTH domain